MKTIRSSMLACTLALAVANPLGAGDKSKAKGQKGSVAEAKVSGKSADPSSG